MRIVYLLTTLLFSKNLFARSGFTWLSSVSHKYHIPEHILTLLIVSLFLIIIGIIYRAKEGKVSNIAIPDKGVTLRNVVEAFGQFVFTQAKAVLGEEGASRYYPFVATVFITILLCNLIGLIPGFAPPTEQMSTTFAFGLCSFIFYNFIGAKETGPINYLKHFAGPLWYMAILIFPIEIISHCIRPFSLALRLRGNMLGDHMVVGIFTDLVPYFIPIVFYLLGILISFIQAYVFTMLTLVYINLATAGHDHEGHEAH